MIVLSQSVSYIKHNLSFRSLLCFVRIPCRLFVTIPTMCPNSRFTSSSRFSFVYIYS